MQRGKRDPPAPLVFQELKEELAAQVLPGMMVMQVIPVRLGHRERLDKMVRRENKGGLG